MTRARQSAITEEIGKLADAWPEVSARLTRLLRARGVSPEEADDVVQEVAVRALRTAVPFAGAADLYPWARVVALRLVVDSYRRSQRLVHQVADRPDDDQDPSAIVEGRLRLSAVTRAITRLSEADRHAIVAPLNRMSSVLAVNAVEANRVRVERHRARARLTAMLERGWLIVVGGASWLRCRARGLRPEVAIALTPLLLASVATLMVVTGVLPAPPGSKVARATGGTVTARGDVDVESAELGGAEHGGRLRSPGLTPTMPPAARLAIPQPGGDGWHTGVWPGTGESPLACVDYVSGERCIPQPVSPRKMLEGIASLPG